MPPPATAAHSAIASRRGSLISARARRVTASSSAWPIDRSGAGGAGGAGRAGEAAGSGTESLLLAGEPQRVDQIVEVAVQHLGQVVNRVVNPVIGDAILREVVGPDLGRAITGAHLRSPLAGTGGLLLGDHLVEQAGAQHFERLDLVLQLALLVLALHHEIRGQVGDAYGAVGRVDALTARSLGAEHVDPEVLVIDLDVDLLRLGKHGHGGGRRVNPALPFGHRYALHAVDPRFIAQRTVYAGTAGGEDGFLQASEIPLGEGDHLDLPAPALAKPGVHAKQLGGEERRFVASRAGADLHNGVAVVQRVDRGEQLGEPLLEAGDLGAQPLQVGAGELRQLGITVLQHFACLAQLLPQPVEPVVPLTDLVEAGVVPAPLPPPGPVSRGLAGGPLPCELLRPRERPW